jgi:hypothetical protein
VRWQIVLGDLRLILVFGKGGALMFAIFLFSLFGAAETAGRRCVRPTPLFNS